MWHFILMYFIMYGNATDSCKYTHLQVRLYVVDRSTREVLKTKYMSADTFYCLHHVNAYEDKGNVACYSLRRFAKGMTAS